LKDAIATLMDDNAMNENPIHSISFFGYSPQSPQQIDEHGNSKNTTDKRFMLKRAVKAKHAGVCDMGLDERDRPLQVCIANSHSKLPKPAKGLFRSGHAPSTVPGTVVCLQFEPSSLKEARTQLGRIMDAVKTHILFDATSLGHDVNVVVPKGLQPSTVFTSVPRPALQGFHLSGSAAGHTRYPRHRRICGHAVQTRFTSWHQPHRFAPA
jgi:hypothetical protein